MRCPYTVDLVTGQTDAQKLVVALMQDAVDLFCAMQNRKRPEYWQGIAAAVDAAMKKRNG